MKFHLLVPIIALTALPIAHIYAEDIREITWDGLVPESAQFDEAVSKLTAENIDIDGLIARSEEITEKRRAQAQTTDAECNGKNGCLPGHLLPLEFEDKKFTEFLLVPLIGACIHTPPLNQIVHQCKVRPCPVYPKK